MSHPRQVTKCGHRVVDQASIAEFRKLLLKDWKNWGRDFPWRRKRGTRYHRVVSEILLQRTQAGVVARFWPRFIRQFPNWKAIARTPLGEVHQALAPIGLAKQRAPRLLALARTLSRTNGRFPSERSRIEALPAVGQYVANAVVMFCHGQRSALVDVNMARVLERFFGKRKLADIRYDPYLQSLAAQVVDHPRAQEVNWAILDHAALVCTAREPRCGRCCLAAQCAYAQRSGAFVSRGRAKG
jgi:A/G-specific adenine glycosylase